MERRVVVAAAVAALLLFQVPLALRDLWRAAREVPPGRRIEALRASQADRIDNAFAATLTGWRPEFREFGRAVPAAEASIPLAETLQIVSPDELLYGLVGDRFGGLLYPRKTRFLSWPLGKPPPPPAESTPELWFLRVGEPCDPSADPRAEVLATGERFTLWRTAGPER